MKILAAYYRLDSISTRHGRERCQEHIPITDAITNVSRPACGKFMDTDAYIWKVIQGEPRRLCRACELLNDKPAHDRAALTAWINGEPSR